MNKVQDSCTGPRFPRIPRFFGSLSGFCLIVPQNLGILGNLGPVHEPALFVHRDSWESWACAGFVTSMMEKAHQTCTGPRFPRIPMNKVQDSCTGPRFPRIPRLFGTLSGSCLIVHENLGILGNLGPVHETLHFVHRDSWESWACAGFVTSMMEKAHQTCTGPRFPRIPMNKVQDSCTGPRFPRIPRFFGTLSGSCLIVPENLGILGNLGPVHESCTLCSSGFLGILGLCRFCDFNDGESSPNLHGPKIPKNPDEQTGFTSRQPGKRQRKREKENQKSEDQFF